MPVQIAGFRSKACAAMEDYMKNRVLVSSGVTVAVCACLILGSAGCSKPTESAGPVLQESKAPDLTKPSLLVELPDYCNTPDGMCLLADNSVVISIPNFNDVSVPPLLMRLTPDNKAEPFYRFPTPYPGLEKGSDRIGPMGISRDPVTGNLYLADNQFAPDKPQKSRLWKLVVKDGKVEKMVLVASGFNIANGTAVRDGYVYITESTLDPVYNPTMRSAVMRFKLDEEQVVLKTPLAEDPHIVATFESREKQWPFGADGITFDRHGNLYIGVFSDGVLYKVVFDADGKVKSADVFAKAHGAMLSCDGMSCDSRTGIIYLADCAGNAVHKIHSDGRVETIARNDDVPDVAAKLKAKLAGLVKE